MDKEESEHYPLKSLHDFLNELDKEWGRFRTASLIGIVSSGLLVAFLVSRFMGLLWRIRNLGLRFVEVLDEFVFLVLVAVFVSYEIYLLLRQYKFYAKWERRVGLLLHLEERLMPRTEERNEQGS
jgi:cytochrome c oxidase subunit IV